MGGFPLEKKIKDLIQNIPKTNCGTRCSKDESEPASPKATLIIVFDLHKNESIFLG